MRRAITRLHWASVLPGAGPLPAAHGAAALPRSPASGAPPHQCRWQEWAVAAAGLTPCAGGSSGSRAATLATSSWLAASSAGISGGSGGSGGAGEESVGAGASVPADGPQQEQQPDQSRQQQQQPQQQPEPPPLGVAAAAPPPPRPRRGHALPGSFTSGARLVQPLRRGGPQVAAQEGIVHVNCSLNNTFVVLTDAAGAVKTYTSGGSVGYRNANKATPLAAEKAAAELARRALEKGFYSVSVRLRGVGRNKQIAVQALAAGGLSITQLREVTPVAYNGCRLPRKRRV